MRNRFASLAKIALSFILAPLLTACNLGWMQPFPDTDLVYQTGEVDNPQIGFVNADGSDQTVLDIPQYLIKPVWGRDGNHIFGLVRQISVRWGYPFAWEQGQRIKLCKEWWAADQVVEIATPNSDRVLINQTARKILLVDLETCDEMRVLVDVGNTNTYIFGISLAPDQQSLLYSVVEDYYTDDLIITIYSQSLSDPKSVEQLGSGIYPAWSPDGQQIAYVNFDGIYLMQVDGSQVSRIVEANFRTKSNLKEFSLVPIPDWSPDGEWLIYHYEEEGNFEEHGRIYKVNVSTGERIFITYGRYPNWRP